jgi:hypothetical protein
MSWRREQWGLAIKALTNARLAAMLNCQTANAALYTRRIRD